MSDYWKVYSWLKSYLPAAHRMLIGDTKDLVGDTYSDPQTLNIGIPQGSVLMPILFGIYLRPLYGILFRHAVKYHDYADDTQIYDLFCFTGTDGTQSAVQTLEACLVDVSAGCSPTNSSSVQQRLSLWWLPVDLNSPLLNASDLCSELADLLSILKRSSVIWE